MFRSFRNYSVDFDWKLIDQFLYETVALGLDVLIRYFSGYHRRREYDWFFATSQPFRLVSFVKLLNEVSQNIT